VSASATKESAGLRTGTTGPRLNSEFERTSATGPRLNSEFDWDAFDPAAYTEVNYRPLHDEDRVIMPIISRFFADSGVTGARGLDIGAGPNLYPSLAMLPFCRRVDLLDFAAPNVRWLERQIQNYDGHWDEFWDIMRQEHAAYADLPDSRLALRRRGVARQVNIFNLRKHQWTMGTMFFVACSISADRGECARAIRHFLRALVDDSPFAAAFMLQSKGYQAGDEWFPAVALSKDDIVTSLAEHAYDLRAKTVTSEEPFRDGYDGMLVVTGRANWKG
jgi:hypothetical protein